MGYEQDMASKEDLEEIIGEYSAKLGIPVPRIVWNTKYESAILVWELLYISSEALESMSVRDLRVEVGYAFARRVLARSYLKVFLMGLLGLTIWVLGCFYVKEFLSPDGMSFWVRFVLQLSFLGTSSFFVFAYHIGNRNCDRIAYGLSRDVEGMKRFLTTKGKINSNGKGVPLDPKALARRTAQLERYVQSQVVGESKR